MIETTVGVAIAFAIVMFGLGVMVALKAGATATSWRERDLRNRLSIERMRPHTHDAGLCSACANVASWAQAQVGASPVRQTAVIYYPALVQMGGGAEGWAPMPDRIAPEDEEDASQRPPELPGWGDPPRSMDDFHRDLDGGPPRR